MAVCRAWGRLPYSQSKAEYTHTQTYRCFFSVFLVALLSGDRMAIDRRKVLLMWLFSINMLLCPHSRHVPAPKLFKLMNCSYGIGVKEVTNASFNNGQVMEDFSKLDGIWGLTSISNRTRQERHFYVVCPLVNSNFEMRFQVCMRFSLW